jgi:DNA-binding response OmpR family regulator
MPEQRAHNSRRPSDELRVLLVHSTHEPELTRSLAREGHDVLTVDDERRARRLLTMFRPDVMLVCTRETGTVRRLRRQNPEVPLVAIVPDDEPELRVAALNAGADDCVSEPFHDAELRARISVAVRGRGEDWQQLRLVDSRTV